MARSIQNIRTRPWYPSLGIKSLSESYRAICILMMVVAADGVPIGLWRVWTMVFTVLKSLFALLAALSGLLLGVSFTKGQRSKYPILKKLDGKQLHLVSVTVVFLIMAAGTEIVKSVVEPDLKEYLEEWAGLLEFNHSLTDIAKSKGKTPERVMDDFKRWIEKDKTLDGKALVAMHDGRNREAVARWEESIRSSLSDRASPSELASKYFYLGNAQFSIGEYDSAIDSYKKAIGSDHPRLALTYNNLGYTYYVQERIHKAIEAYRKSINVHKNSGTASIFHLALTHYNLGNAYFDRDEYDKAMVAYEEAISELDLNEESNRQLLARAQQNLAYSYITKAGVVGKDQQTLYYQEAERKLREAEKTIKIMGAPLPAELKRNRGRIYIGLRQFEDAIMALEEAKKTDPDNSDVYLLLATAYRGAGDEANANSNLHKFVEKQTDVEKLSEGFSYIESNSN